MVNDTQPNPYMSPGMDVGSGHVTPGDPPAVWPYVLPFIAYMLISTRTPVLLPASVDDVAVTGYQVLVVVQSVVAFALVCFFLRRYLRDFPLRIDIWGFVVGIVGFALWIGICELGIEARALSLVGLGDWLPDRVGFNPFAQITDPTRQAVFLVFRFFLLVAMVPIVEELFLRGWLVRFFEDEEWFRVKVSDVGKSGVLAVAVYAMATHPGEAVAAVVWFSLVTLLMIRTGKFWNCVVAHAVTNLLLGIYVVWFSQWQYW